MSKFHLDEIKKLARAHHLQDPLENVNAFGQFLKYWWCRHYNRPFKDPLLESYTMNELCYEYLRIFYQDPENDPKKELEAKKLKESDDEWIQSQMSKLAAPAAAAAEKAKEIVTQPDQSIEPLMPPDISTKFGDST